MKKNFVRPFSFSVFFFVAFSVYTKSAVADKIMKSDDFCFVNEGLKNDLYVTIKVFQDQSVVAYIRSIGDSAHESTLPATFTGTIKKSVSKNQGDVLTGKLQIAASPEVCKQDPFHENCHQTQPYVLPEKAQSFEKSLVRWTFVQKPGKMKLLIPALIRFYERSGTKFKPSQYELIACNDIQKKKAASSDFVR